MNMTAQQEVRAGSEPAGKCPVGQSLGRARASILLVLTLAVCLSMDFFFFTGYYGSDDGEYFRAANWLAYLGTLDENADVGQLRLVTVGWCAMVALLTDGWVQAMSASFILLHCVLVLLTYVLAVRCSDRIAAIIAAYLTATLPLLVTYSSGIFPDLLVAIFLVLAVLAFDTALQRRAQMRCFAAASWMLTAGICACLSYMAKESGLVVLPVFFLAWLLNEIRHWRRSRSRLDLTDRSTGSVEASAIAPRNLQLLRVTAIGAMFAVGFLVGFILEYLLLSHLTGKPTFRLAWTGREIDLSSVPNFAHDGGFSPAGRLLAALREIGPPNIPYAVLLMILISCIAYPFMRRRKWLVLGMGLYIFAYFTWGTYSLSHYYPPRIQGRYYIPMWPFLCSILSVFVAWIMERIGSSFRSAAARGGAQLAIGQTFADRTR